MHTEPNTPDQLERSLASLTAGPDGEPTLWQTALERNAPPAADHATSIWHRRIPAPWLAAACVALVLGLSAPFLLPSPSGARVPSASVSSEASLSSVKKYGNLASLSRADVNAADTVASYISEDITAKDVLESAYPPSRKIAEKLLVARTQGQPAATGTTPPLSLSADRFVIRKSTLDLTATEPRVTFAKVNLVLNEALGEYVETSSLTGDGTSATVTLRVAAGRLSEVLNQLRTLGKVTSETSSGQDVTEKAVDLDARVRNEQRIEKELLELIDKRPDAPLKDLLEIRAQLASVRNEIESLIGQRERLGRLVSLATVLVTIRQQDAPKPVEKTEAIGDYFKASIERSWHASLLALADTAAFLVRAFVGGLVWWVIAIVAVTATWRIARRSLAKRATEPAPVG